MFVCVFIASSIISITSISIIISIIIVIITPSPPTKSFPTKSP